MNQIIQKIRNSITGQKKRTYICLNCGYKKRTTGYPKYCLHCQSVRIQCLHCGENQTVTPHNPLAEIKCINCNKTINESMIITMFELGN